MVIVSLRTAAQGCGFTESMTFKDLATPFADPIRGDGGRHPSGCGANRFPGRFNGWLPNSFRPRFARSFTPRSPTRLLRRLTPLLGPLLNRPDNRFQGAPLLGEAVLDEHRLRIVHDAVHDAGSLQLAQPLRQQPVAHLGHLPFQIGEALGTVHQNTEQQPRPLFSQQRHRSLVTGAHAAVVHGHHLTSIVPRAPGGSWSRPSHGPPFPPLDISASTNYSIGSYKKVSNRGHGGTRSTSPASAPPRAWQLLGSAGYPRTTTTRRCAVWQTPRSGRSTRPIRWWSSRFGT